MNKQIEEMAHLVCERDAEDLCTLDRKRCDMKCTSGDIAKHLYSHGYRKASDVLSEAMKIASRSAEEAKTLAETESDALQKSELRGEQIGALLVLHAFAELKKKYESEGADDGR